MSSPGRLTAAEGLLDLRRGEDQAAHSLLSLRSPHSPRSRHSARAAVASAAQSTLLAQEAARRARESRLAVHRHNAAAKLQAVARGNTSRKQHWRPKGMRMTGFTVGVASPSDRTRRNKRRNNSKKSSPLPKYVSTGSTKRRRTMGGKYKPKRKKSKSKKRKN
jgi:hypothetical protein